ncbi:hypothetical protein KIPB_015319, partial [Kipferlia bialata]
VCLKETELVKKAGEENDYVFSVMVREVHALTSLSECPYVINLLAVATEASNHVHSAARRGRPQVKIFKRCWLVLEYSDHDLDKLLRQHRARSVIYHEDTACM